MIPTHCGMPGDLSNEVSWFLSLLSFSQYVNQTTKSDISPIYYCKKYALKICIKKSLPRKQTIRNTGFPKPKTNF